jgi:hypothetical protein
VAADGEVGVEPEPDAGTTSRVATGDEIPTDAWLSLSRGSRLVAKDPRTTRETIFSGPARVRACVRHREETWLASGIFESTPGAGETPGAEEWVDTPLAVVRYAAAKIRVAVRPEVTTITVAGGVAFVRAEADARVSATPQATPLDAGQEPWLRLGEGSLEIRPIRRAPPVDSVRSAMEECSSLAARAETLARLVFPPDGAGGVSANLHDTIVEQVRTRQLARAACAAAELRVRGLPPSLDRTPWLTALGDAETRWSTLAPSTTSH